MHLVIIVLIVVIVFLLLISCKENFGQDASIRVSAGGIAGPSGLYGTDPITEFQKQIEEDNSKYYTNSGNCGSCS